MDDWENQNENEWVQLEIPGLFEQLENPSDSNSEDEVETNLPGE